MKNKNILIAIISMLFFSTNIFAQGPGKWSKPIPHPCYKGLFVSVVNMGYNENRKDYPWGVRIINNYKIPVSFKYLLSVGGEKMGSTKFQYSVAFKLGPGKEEIDGKDLFTAISFQSSSDDWTVMIGEVCFDGMRCGGEDECYAECDKDIENPKPNQPCGLSGAASSTNPKNEFEPSYVNGTEPDEDDGESKVRSGIWTNGLNYSKVKITVTKDGLTYHSVNGPDDGSPFFKRISATEYRRYDPGGVLFCSLTLKEDERLHHICHDKPASYVKVEELVFSSAEEEEKTGNNSEWKYVYNDKYRQIITFSEDGLVISVKGGLPRSYILKKTGENTYERKNIDGSRTVIKLASNSSYLYSFFNSKGKQVPPDLLYILVSTEGEKKPKSIVPNYPAIDIKGKWNYLGIAEYTELQLTANGENLFANFTGSGFKDFPYTKVHQYFYTYDTDTTKSSISYINDTTLSISYQHRNLKKLSYYTRPAAAPIVKQENKPVTISSYNGIWRMVGNPRYDKPFPNGYLPINFLKTEQRTDIKRQPTDELKCEYSGTVISSPINSIDWAFSRNLKKKTAETFSYDTNGNICDEFKFIYISNDRLRVIGNTCIDGVVYTSTAEFERIK